MLNGLGFSVYVFMVYGLGLLKPYAAHTLEGLPLSMKASILRLNYGDSIGSPNPPGNYLL